MVATNRSALGERHRCNDEAGRGHAGDQADRVGVAFGQWSGDTTRDDQGSAGHGRDEQGSDQEDYHNVPPETPTARSPTNNQTRYEDGLRVCTRSLATPIQRVATTVPRTVASMAWRSAVTTIRASLKTGDTTVT